MRACSEKAGGGGCGGGSGSGEGWGKGGGACLWEGEGGGGSVICLSWRGRGRGGSSSANVRHRLITRSEGTIYYSSRPMRYKNDVSVSDFFSHALSLSRKEDETSNGG